MLLGPCLHGAGLLVATPYPFTPSQPHPPTERIDVTHDDLASAVRTGDHTARGTADSRRSRLDADLELAVHLRHAQNHEAGQSEHDSIARPTLHVPEASSTR
jgi:hypothetical protein